MPKLYHVSHIISSVAPPRSCGPSWLHGSSASQAVLLLHAFSVSLGCLLCVCPAFSDLYAPLAFCFPLFLSWCLRSPFLVSCSLPAFCALPFAFRWSWPCASFLELLPFLVSICPFASTIYCLRYSPLLMIYFHFILPCIISCLTYHLICCSSSFLRSVVASWLVCVSGCAPAPCLLCVPWLPPLRLPCLFWSVCSPCLLLPFVLVLMLPVSFSCPMFLACFLCFAFCLSLKLALRFILGASAPPPSCGPSWPPLFISYCLVLYHVSLYHISSHMLLLLLPAARRGFMVRLRLRLFMPSMCPLVASSAFALPFLICMLPLPFASLCSCPDASGLLFLSHVPCLLSVLCLLPFVEVGPALHSWSFCPSWFPSALSPRLYIASDIPPFWWYTFISYCLVLYHLSHIISCVAPPRSCSPSWLHGSSASQAVLLIHAFSVSLGCLLCVCPAFSDLYAPLAFCFPLFLSWCFRSPFLVSCSLPAYCVLPCAIRWSWPWASFLELLQACDRWAGETRQRRLNRMNDDEWWWFDDEWYEWCRNLQRWTQTRWIQLQQTKWFAKNALMFLLGLQQVASWDMATEFASW